MKIFSSLLIAVALFTTGNFALAAPGPADHGRSGHSHQRSHDRQGNRHQNRRSNHRRSNHRYSNHQRPAQSRYNNRHYGYRPHHRGYSHSYRPVHHRSNWRRGHRYQGPTYVVRDYGYYRLRQPPRGYHWVRANNDYLLVAVATGIILDIALR